MVLIRNAFVALTILLAPISAFATEVNCESSSTKVEELRYRWRVRGGLRWVAGIMFPTAGVGNLKTVYPGAGQQAVSSELLITPANGPSGGFFSYESQMDPAGRKTLMTAHGYSWGKKGRRERTVFDYVKRLARIHKETPEKVEDKVRKMPADDFRDVLTAIYYLRQNAGDIRAPLQTSIYSEGKEYPVVFRPAGRRQFEIDGKRMNAMAFEIVDAPGGKKWPGGVKVYLSDDARRIPFRIEISQSMASLQLDLQSVEACGYLSARK